MINNKSHITQGGLADLKSEYQQLNNKRPRLVERLTDARNAGDLSENSDYLSAKEELEFMDNRLAELAEIISSAILITNGNKSAVSLGSRVTVTTNGAKHIFHIVGEWEADPKEKKISHESPLGKMLLGKKVGDAVEVNAPAGKIVYKVLSIE
ncbi:transcription elongation factor GreA [Candidatus Microgenomates bacterium]|nr:transcription elongation factor GreA [Candidatus Microgenomates bacterium]